MAGAKVEKAPVVMQAPGPDAPDTNEGEQSEGQQVEFGTDVLKDSTIIGADHGVDLHATTDASVWAAEFMRTFPDDTERPDEGTMIGWFANAMETARAAGAQEAREAASEPAPADTTVKHRIGRVARSWLREAAAAVGVDRAKANSMADWLEKNRDANIQIIADQPVPEPPLRVFSTPDVAPMPTLRPQEEQSDQVFNEREPAT